MSLLSLCVAEVVFQKMASSREVRLCLLAKAEEYTNAKFVLADTKAPDFSKQKIQFAKMLGIDCTSSEGKIELTSTLGVPFECSSHFREGDDVIVRFVPNSTTPKVESNEEKEVTADAKKEPRVVTVSFFVNAVKSLDAIEGTVEVDFQLYLSWVDPSLAVHCSCSCTTAYALLV